MKTILIGLLAACLFTGCVKSTHTEPEIVVCPSPTAAWIQEKQKEYANCACKVQFVAGVYNNTSVLEIRIVDPVCDGINVVYKSDGTILLNSMDQAAYQHYASNVKNAQVYWECSKPQNK